MQHAHHTPATAQEMAAAIPVFTKEFIQHNKGREEEVRLLLRSNFQLERQSLALYARVREKEGEDENKPAHVLTHALSFVGNVDGGAGRARAQAFGSGGRAAKGH